ncbi:hypothetical protein B0T20DRAFT_19311 [Sordaria brevicollis]|uniref:Uncharacterized protein n=1 Tax=Sordaria brevicollis TaxID=83679 RepID=A0AAE0PP66_SORBR|nr:hypothetical protein B0T20DRAFT_19311 [Sordaria brevicollis]
MKLGRAVQERPPDRVTKYLSLAVGPTPLDVFWPLQKHILLHVHGMLRCGAQALGKFECFGFLTDVWDYYPKPRLCLTLRKLVHWLQPPVLFICTTSSDIQGLQPYRLSDEPWFLDEHQTSSSSLAFTTPHTYQLKACFPVTFHEIFNFYRCGNLSRATRQRLTHSDGRLLVTRGCEVGLCNLYGQAIPTLL